MNPLEGATKTKDAPEGWVEIGRIGKPHGVHGALYIRLHNADSDLIAPDLAVGLLLGDNWIERKVVEVNGGGAVTLESVKGRDAADTLKHALAFVHRDDFPALDEDEVYLADLEGADVFAPDGAALGVVESFDDNGAQPLMQVRTPDQRLVDVPFVGAFLVDISPGRITLDAPDGLFNADDALDADAKPTGPRSPRGRAKKRREALAKETAAASSEEDAS